MSFRDLLVEEKDLLKDSSTVFLSNSIASLLLFLANLYLSKLLGHVMFGSFKTVLYLFSLAFSMIEFGMSVTLSKYIADPKTRRKTGYLLKSFIRIRVVSFVLLTVGMIVFRDFIALQFLHDQGLSYLLIAGIALAMSSFFAFIKEMVRGYENFKLYSMSIFVTKALSLVIGCGLVYLFGVFYAIVGFGISGIVGDLICLKFLFWKKSFVVKERIDVKKVFLSYSLPMHILRIPGYLGSAIVPLLSLFFSQEVMGYYSFAFMFYFMTAMIPGSVQTVLFPKVSRMNSNGNGKDAEKSLKSVFKIYTPIVVVGVAGILMFSGMAVKALFSDYLPGLPIFKAMVSLGLVFGYFGIYSSYLAAKGNIGRTALIILAQNVLMFLVSYLVLYWLL